MVRERNAMACIKCDGDLLDLPVRVRVMERCRFPPRTSDASMSRSNYYQSNLSSSYPLSNPAGQVRRPRTPDKDGMDPRRTLLSKSPGTSKHQLHPRSEPLGSACTLNYLMYGICKSLPMDAAFTLYLVLLFWRDEKRGACICKIQAE